MSVPAAIVAILAACLFGHFRGSRSGYRAGFDEAMTRHMASTTKAVADAKQAEAAYHRALACRDGGAYCMSPTWRWTPPEETPDA